jgi:hypothetical protein
MGIDPITTTVEKKALDSAFDLVRKLWSWHTDVVKENKALKERLDTRAEFDRKKAEAVRQAGRRQLI